jgi:hypothetical protein
VVFVDLTDVVDTANVRVSDLAGDLNLIEKAIETGTVLFEGSRQELQSDRLSELEIVGTVNLAHAAAAEEREMMRYRLASTVPGMNRALSSEGWEVVAGWLLRLVSVGADVGVSIAAPQEPQKRFPFATSLAHDGQVATVPSSRRGRGPVN